MGGNSLLEMLMALLLGSLLLLGLMQLYFSIQAENKLIKTTIQAQADARFTIDFLTQRIRAAGYHGCEGGITTKNNVYGYNNFNLPFQWRNTVKANTDIIIVSGCLHYHNKNQFIKTAYYVAQSARYDMKGFPIFALYQKPLQGNRAAVMANLQDLKFHYGIYDTQGDMHYFSADQIINWALVKAIRIKIVFNQQIWIFDVPLVA